MKRFLTLLLCLTLLVSMAALPATSLAEETVELTFYYPVGVGGRPGAADRKPGGGIYQGKSQHHH